jgi:hypothetical protein
MAVISTSNVNPTSLLLMYIILSVPRYNGIYRTDSKLQVIGDHNVTAIHQLL